MDRTTILLEEYRQVYGLALFRLNALDQRVPVFVGAITAMLGTTGALTGPVQHVLLVAMPLTLVWLARTTMNHARSFEDALRRIEEIERAVSARSGEPLLQFQSSHPSRGKAVGGRTGSETIEAVLAASAVLLGASLYMVQSLREPAAAFAIGFAGYVALVALALLAMRWRLQRYRYQPRP